MLLLALAVAIIAMALAYIQDCKIEDIPMLFFEVYEDRAGEFRWRLKSRNGRIVGTSGEGYTRKRDCYRAIENIKKCLFYTAPPIKDLT